MKKPAQRSNQTSTNLSYVTTEEERQSCQPETDLPPTYDTIAETDLTSANESIAVENPPDLIATMLSSSNDCSDGPPTYDEAYASMTDPEIAPPSYDAVADDLPADNISTVDELRFRRSSSSNSTNATSDPV